MFGLVVPLQNHWKWVFLLQELRELVPDVQVDLNNPPPFYVWNEVWSPIITSVLNSRSKELETHRMELIELRKRAIILHLQRSKKPCMA